MGFGQQAKRAANASRPISVTSLTISDAVELRAVPNLATRLLPDKHGFDSIFFGVARDLDHPLPCRASARSPIVSYLADLLRAISAVFRTGTRLDRNKLQTWTSDGSLKPSMHFSRRNQLKQRQGVNSSVSRVPSRGAVQPLLTGIHDLPSIRGRLPSASRRDDVFHFRSLVTTWQLPQKKQEHAHRLCKARTLRSFERLRMAFLQPAQIFNLPYRRFVIGRASNDSRALDRADAPQNAILRYGRLKICATAPYTSMLSSTSLPCRTLSNTSGFERPVIIPVHRRVVFEEVARLDSFQKGRSVEKMVIYPVIPPSPVWGRVVP